MSLEKSVFTEETIKEYIYNNYHIKTINVCKQNIGSANCYKIISKDGIYLLKEFQSKYKKSDIEREITVCNYLNQHGISCSDFIQNADENYINVFKEKTIHLQTFVEGKTFQMNCVPDTILFKEAGLLGRINKCLENFLKLPIGFNSSWFVSWNSDESINMYKKIIYHTEKLDDINIKAKIIEDCEFKIKLLSNMTLDERYCKLTQGNSHGDYNNFQLICSDNDIKSVIDFSGAAYVPLVWEVMRSYTYSAEECRNAKDMDFEKFKKYIDAYLKENELTLLDVEMMPYFYYFNIVRSAYGYPQYINSCLESNPFDIIDFAVWRTEFCRWLYKNKDELSQFLKNQYKGILL